MKRFHQFLIEEKEKDLTSEEEAELDRLIDKHSQRMPMESAVDEARKQMGLKPLKRKKKP
jgi:hypothetical protein